MAPRTGRPTEDPKKTYSHIRMSEREVEMLNYCCEFYGLNKADVIRQGIKEMYEKALNKEE